MLSFLLILGADQAATNKVLLLIGIMIAAVIAGGLIILVLRRRLLQREANDAAAGGLMENLREMVRTGQISEEEFKLARRKMADRIAGRNAAGPGGHQPRQGNAARARKSPDHQ